MYNQSGAEENIRNRSWSRKGGKSLLIQDITKQDEGKVVVCSTEGANGTNYGTIGFAVISYIPGDDSSSSDPKTGGRTPKSGNKHNIYLVLTLLFFSLWFITTIVGGVFLWVKTKMNKSDTTVSSPSPSGYASRASHGRSNENETPLSSVGTRGRRDPDTTNTNNSAHNPIFEPETFNTDENRRNDQGSDGSHLYFTLEKSSPSPKASTSRQERPGSSLNHPKSSQWQSYETVGDPNKGVFCSFDVGEYADVSFQGKVTSDHNEYSEVDSTQFRGTAPPGDGEYSEVRRSFRGNEQPTLPDRTSLNKIPEREQVERDEISRLYGKRSNKKMSKRGKM
ncbi:uncharacterized protein LOC121411572 [Lytechinus variegatus]|uniref:uncharacterized protein LOC121411572 n=1 Tax=Lytechinus variegatus TaxID=7654 RepID=UPI001BB0E6B9|nr:uncharacterized protein LOC121411572 [Lytechinus variegatus]